MKAHEVLEQYTDGRRDFSGENLRGQSFIGKNLSGANFSEADIRGANFTNAKLIGANFKGAKAGLQRRWAISLVLFSYALFGLSGILAISVGFLTTNGFFTKNEDLITSLTTSVVLVLFYFFTIRNGITVSLIINFIAAGGGGVVIAGVVAIARALTLALPLALALPFAGAIARGLAFAVAGVVTFAVAFAVVGARASAFALIGASAVAFTVTVAGASAVAFARASTFARGVAVVVVLLDYYVSWRAIAGDKKQAFIHNIAIAYAAIGGTSFHGANLTDADLSNAILKSTDFRKAILTRTRWWKAVKLDRSRPGNTYLKNARLRQLLITRQGQEIKFDREDLRGVNFQGANLQDASFIGADLSQANLQDADLSSAKLVQTQLDETDLTGATLTGATIEDWGITSHTKLDGIKCKYIFMREPTKEDPNPRRKPDNWKEIFEDDDFADFIKPIVETLDLYHNQDVDPRAIAVSFKKLAENHPEAELEIVAMEKRGGNKFLLRAATTPEANHSELNAEYFATYNEIKALAEQEIKALLDEKDSRISSLEHMIATALQRPSFYVETNKGDIMSESKGNVNITSGDSSKISGIAGAGENMTSSAMADVSGTVTNTINQLPTSSEPGKPGLKELLAQLQATINDPNLAEDDKTQALEQIKVLAEAGQNAGNEAAQKQAKKALGFLKVIAEGVPSAAKLVEAWKELLPAIAHFFGL